MNKRLKHIEDVIEVIVVKTLPEVNISKEEKEEIEQAIQEIKNGNYGT